MPSLDSTALIIMDSLFITAGLWAFVLGKRLSVSEDAWYLLVNEVADRPFAGKPFVVVALLKDKSRDSSHGNAGHSFTYSHAFVHFSKVYIAYVANTYKTKLQIPSLSPEGLFHTHTYAPTEVIQCLFAVTYTVLKGTGINK